MQGDERALKSRSEIAQLRQIQVFAGISKTGDRGDLAQIPERRDLAARDLHARELPGPGMSAHPRLFRGQGAAPGAGRRRGGGQPRALHGRPGAARRGRDRPAARGRHGDLRRSPPAARHGHAFPGQQRVHAPAAGFRPRAGSGGPGLRARSRALGDVSRHLETAARELRLVCAPLDKLPGRKATFEAMPEAEEFDQALAVLREAVDTATNALGAVAESIPT